MNLQNLFELQKQLDEHIEKIHPRQEGEDRLAKKILALQVELAECAQESRCFKYWSHDQEPRIRVYDKQKSRIDKTVWKNPLLEEYVDCLHFILSIGLELKEKYDFGTLNLETGIKPLNTIDHFNSIFVSVTALYQSIVDYEYFDNADRQAIYEEVFEKFNLLGELLGFTLNQIKQDYLEKNKVNHQRQVNGY